MQESKDNVSDTDTYIVLYLSLLFSNNVQSHPSNHFSCFCGKS